MITENIDNKYLLRFHNFHEFKPEKNKNDYSFIVVLKNGSVVEQKYKGNQLDEAWNVFIQDANNLLLYTKDKYLDKNIDEIIEVFLKKTSSYRDEIHFLLLLINGVESVISRHRWESYPFADTIKISRMINNNADFTFLFEDSYDSGFLKSGNKSAVCNNIFVFLEESIKNRLCHCEVLYWYDEFSVVEKPGAFIMDVELFNKIFQKVKDSNDEFVQRFVRDCDELLRENNGFVWVSLNIMTMIRLFRALTNTNKDIIVEIKERQAQHAKQQNQ